MENKQLKEIMSDERFDKMYEAFTNMGWWMCLKCGEVYHGMKECPYCSGLLTRREHNDNSGRNEEKERAGIC